MPDPAAPSASPAHVRRIGDDSAFLALREDWNRLAALTRADDVFLRHEWFDAAWQWLGHERRLAILGVEQNGELIGICPLVHGVRSRHHLRIRCLEFLKIPDTQGCDILAAPAHRERVIDAVFEHLARRETAWDLLDLRTIPEDSPTLAAARAAARRHGLAWQAHPHERNPGIDLQGTWQDFYGRRSRRLKKGNNHVANRLRRSGAKLEIIQLKDCREIGNALEDAIAVSAASWKTTTGLTLDQAAPGAFIRRLTEHACREGWLSLWLLKLDGKVAAMEYQLHYEGIVSALRADFDKAFDELSPGTYLNWKILEALFDSDAKYYAMGPGQNDYKLRWAEEFPELYRFAAYNRSLRGWLLSLVDLRLKPFLAKRSARVETP